MGKLYLIHLDPPFKHAAHYLGYTSRADVEDRVAEHRAGRGANMLRHAVASGSSLTIARVWMGKTRKNERSLKGRSLRPLCPHCKERH